jgi:hypothetical protein
VDALELQQEPSLAAQLIALAERAHHIYAEGRDAAPQPAVAHPHANQGNLPARLPRFIGRQQDLSEVLWLVRERGLLTLTGPGGMGETGLALEVGWAVCRGTDAPSHAATFLGGVWLVELAPLVDPAAVPRAVAEVFRLPDEVDRTYTAALIERLAAARGRWHDKEVVT